MASNPKSGLFDSANIHATECIQKFVVSKLSASSCDAFLQVSLRWKARVLERE
jgi:hypothetical protein